MELHICVVAIEEFVRYPVSANILSKEYAAKANKLIGSITPVLQAMEFKPGDRVRLSRSLVKSSIDIGFSATALIATNDNHNGISALVLMRPQLEHLFRGIYIGTTTLASDAFVSAFKVADQWRGPTFQELSEHAAAVLANAPMGAGVSQWDKLPKMVKFVKNDLHGFVHGGAAVARVYRHPCGIAFSSEHFDNGMVITNITAAAIFGLSFAQSICVPSSNGAPSDVADFINAYRDWVCIANAMGLGPAPRPEATPTTE